MQNGMETAPDLSLIAVAADAMLIVDEQGVIRLANLSAEQLLGRSTAELVGEIFGSPMLTGETIDMDVRRKDGSVAVAEMRVVHTIWQNEPVFLASLRDITKRKRSEEALKAAHDQLESRIINRTAELACANELLQKEILERKRVEQELLRTAVSRSLVGQMLRDLRMVGNLSQGSMFRAGQELAERVAANTAIHTPMMSLQHLLEAYTMMGLGTLTLMNNDHIQQRWQFSGDGLVEIEMGHDQPTCYYTQGFLCGAVAHFLSNVRVAGVELSCQSMGDSHCLFIVQVVQS